VSKVENKKSERHVLIVDDDRDYLAAAGNSFRALSQGRWQVHLAHSAELAHKTLRAEKIELVVLVVNSPVLDIPLLLGSFGHHHPRLKKVVLTNDGEKTVAGAEVGADLALEKPVSPEGLKSVFARLCELPGWAAPEGFQSVLHSVGLADLVQMECLARNSSILELYREQSLGRIYIEAGQIIHAVCGEMSGERAFQKLLGLAGGTFELHDFEPPPERTLNRTWEHLLSEAARQRESSNLRTRTNGTFSASGESVSSEPAAQASEMLICSGTGEVLYHWQCPAAAARVRLMQNIARRAEQLMPELQLGKLDRLEIQQAGSRAILQPRADRLVFVRVATTRSANHEG
jgi:CheY-like chemotaxis protein